MVYQKDVIVSTAIFMAFSLGYLYAPLKTIENATGSQLLSAQSLQLSVTSLLQFGAPRFDNPLLMPSAYTTIFCGSLMHGIVSTAST